jgi:hypothetical protein
MSAPDEHLRVPYPVPGENVPVTLTKSGKREVITGISQEIVAAALVAPTCRAGVTYRRLGQVHF